MKITNLNIPVSGRRFFLILALAIAVNLWTVADAMAQRGRGGGMRGGGGSRGGGARSSSSYGRTPSMSRPTQSSRPSTGNRATTGNRANQGNRSAGNRSAGGNRATAGNRNTAGNRAGAGSRSEALNQAGRGSRVSSNELSNFLGGGEGAGGGARAQGANSAVNDFFSHDASTQPHNSSLGHQRSENISNRTDARSDVRSSRGENRDFASDNRQDRVQGRGDRQATRVSTRGEFRSDLAAGRGDRQTDRQVRRGEAADQIRDHLDEHYDHDHLFDDFWENNPQAHYRFHQNPVFWTWATVGTVRAFMPWNWGGGGGGYSEPYYDDGTVYADGQEIPADEYAQQAEEIVNSAPEVENPDDIEWLPLGVFALTEDENATATPIMFLQLAVSKEGIIAGNYQNKETDETVSVEGMVDQDSKRAAWTIVGKSSPIMEVPLENLTANETSALLHFADGSTQQWMMLHVENPDATNGSE